MGKKTLLFELFLRSILPPFYSYKMVENVCKKKLKKRPNDKNVLWVLSNLYINYKKYDKARLHLETLVNQGIDTKSVRLLLARIYYKQSQYEKVKNILKQGAVLSPDDKENYYIGDSLVELKDYEASIKYFNEYLKNHKSEYVPFVKLGYAYYMRGSYDLAIDAYYSAERLNPNNAEIKDSIEICLNEIKKSQNFQ